MMTLYTGNNDDNADAQQAMELMELMDDELMQLVLKEADEFDVLDLLDMDDNSDGSISDTTNAPSTPEADPVSPTQANANGKAKTQPKAKGKSRKRRRRKTHQSLLVDEVQELEQRVQELLRKRHEREQHQQERKKIRLVGRTCNGMNKMEKDIHAIRLDNGLGVVIRPSTNGTNEKCPTTSQQLQQRALQQMSNIAHQLQELLCNADTESHHTASGSDSDVVKRRRVEDCHRSFSPSNTSLLECFDDQTRVQWLLERLDFSFQQMDLVMLQYLNDFSTINMQSTLSNLALNCDPSSWPLALPFNPDAASGPPACPLVSPQSAFSVLQHTLRTQHDPKVSIYEDFAEISDSKLTPFDQTTVMDVLWKCFSVQTKDSDDDASAKSSIDDGYLSSVLHGTVRFTACVKRLGMNVHLEIHGAIKKTSNEIVWETVGRMSPVEGMVTDLESYAKSLPSEKQVALALAQTDFTESVWCRVDRLPGGHTVVHHVHRAAPVVNPFRDDSSHTCLRDDKAYHRQQLQVLAEMMNIGREKTMQLIQELIQSRFSDMPSSSLWLTMLS